MSDKDRLAILREAEKSFSAKVSKREAAIEHHQGWAAVHKKRKTTQDGSWVKEHEKWVKVHKRRLPEEQRILALCRGWIEEVST